MADEAAEIHSVIIHAVPGFTTLPTHTVPLLSDSTASVWLTVEPDELCIHADRASALVELLATGGLKNAFDERFASAMKDVRSRRKRHARSHAWLVTDAFLPNARHRHAPLQRELPDFGLSINSGADEERDDLDRLADSASGRVVTALSIILGESQFPDIKKVGSAIYYLQPGNPRPTYYISVVTGSPSLSISSPASEHLIETLTHCVDQLQTVGVETALRLHKDALESDDRLRTFIAAWASLEIFARKLFNATFSPAVLSGIGLGDSGWEGDLYKRLRSREKGVAIEDCFAFLAVLLSKNSAKDDIDLFASLNEARNDLYHEGVVAKHLRSRDAINLFRKYLALKALPPK
ncbi:hypothetical protein [Bradyrhizobium sp. RT5a]|uniref:hypothetical protein n=1 Tax=Bradyrhizobium sp. RT5a TaxID=3156380 RepID=UPI00339140CB